MKKVLIQDDNNKWWGFDIPSMADDQMTFFEEGYRGEYFAIQPYMEGDGWERVDGGCEGPDFNHCINGVLKAPYILFGLGGDEGAVRGSLVRMK